MRPTVEIRRHKFRELPKLHGKTKVKVGYPASDVKPAVIMRAIWTHFGTKRGIPPRPWLYIAMRKNQNKYRAAMKKFASSIFEGKSMTLEHSLRLLGELAKGDIQKSLIALRTPPNKPATIKRKKSSNPLIDTGEMNQSTTYQIVD